MFNTSQMLFFLISGLSFGALYAMSSVGLLVLYRTTGVINFAFGAIAAFGAHITWTLINKTEWSPDWFAYLSCVIVAVVLTMFYGLVLAPRFSNRDDLSKMLGTVGLTLILYGVMFTQWPPDKARNFRLPTKTKRWEFFDTRVNLTQIIAVLFSLFVVVGVTLFLNRTRLGSAMRAVANDREIASLLGIPVRRVETVAWLGAGLICGVVALLLEDLLGSISTNGITWFVIPALAPVAIARLSSLWVAFVASFVIGVVQAELSAFEPIDLATYRNLTPYVFALVATLWFARKRTIVISGRGTH